MSDFALNQGAIKDLSGADLNHLYNLFSKNNGYTQNPPTISEFISNDYYLGQSLDSGNSVFPYWKQKLVEIYPTPFFETNKYKVILLSGATGIGKCLGKNQEIEFQLSDFDIKKYNLEEYLVE